MDISTPQIGVLLFYMSNTFDQNAITEQSSPEAKKEYRDFIDRKNGTEKYAIGVALRFYTVRL